MSEWFRPNGIKPAEERYEQLEDWQLFVMAIHFSPRMRDCVSADFEYRLAPDGAIIVRGDGDEEVDLTADLMTSGDPWPALEQYIGARTVLLLVALQGRAQYGPHGVLKQRKR